MEWILFGVVLVITNVVTFLVTRRYIETNWRNYKLRQLEQFAGLIDTVTKLSELTVVAGLNPRHYNCEQRIQLRVLLKQLREDRVPVVFTSLVLDEV